MFESLMGGGVAAPASVYRHAAARVISSVLGPLSSAGGWSPAAVALAAVLMSLDAAPTLAQRFESALAVLDRSLPRRRHCPRLGRTFQGFVKALMRCSASLLATLVPRLREQTEHAAGKLFRIGRRVPIGVDGSRVGAPRTVANEALGLAGRDKCGPQMLLLFLHHLGAMLPWGFKVGGACDAERTLLRGSLDQLPRDALLVMDAGFTGFDLLSELRRRGVSFLVRVGKNVRVLTELGVYRCEGKHTVYLWPDARRSCPPLVLRMIRVGSAWLITDVFDPRQLPRSMASELYRRRWGVEVAFRSLKQTLERRKVRSCSPGKAWRELEWSVVSLWTLMLAGASALGAGGGVKTRRLSVAAALATLWPWRRCGPGDAAARDAHAPTRRRRPATAVETMRAGRLPTTRLQVVVPLAEQEEPAAPGRAENRPSNQSPNPRRRSPCGDATADVVHGVGCHRLFRDPSR